MFGETTNSHVKFSVTIHNDTIEPVEDVADKIDNEISVRVDQMGELDMIKIGPFDSTARVATPPDLSDKKEVSWTISYDIGYHHVFYQTFS